MRPDLGRLAAVAEILQIRPVLGGVPAAWPCGARGDILSRKCREHSMRVFRAALVFALGSLFLLSGLTGAARAQQLPNINLLADQPSKTQEEKDADEAKEKAYKETLKKIPDAKVSSDPWGGVRSTDTAKTPAAKTTASAKPKSKTGSNPN
jgi:hypothetical protein